MSALVTGQALTLGNWGARGMLPVGGLMLRLDGLGAFFLVIIGLVGLAAAIYGFGYSANYDGRYSLRMAGAMLNLLLLALGLQVMADNALTFLIAWEAMSLSAYWLVLTEHDRAETVRAAVWYISMTHAGFAALMAMFLLMAGGDLTASFEGMRRTRRRSRRLARRDLRAGALRLRLEGGHCSAARLAADGAPGSAQPRVRADVGRGDQDGRVRTGAVTLDLLGGGPAWWGGVVLGVGAVSALLGVLYALMEHDLQATAGLSLGREHRDHSDRHGRGLIFHSYGLTSLAALGFIGGLYHTLNHAASRACSSSARGRCCTRPARAIWKRWAG